MSIEKLKDFAGAAFKTEIEKALGPMMPMQDLQNFVTSIEKQQAEARAKLANTTLGKSDSPSATPTKADGQ